jgi:uncharacterized protein (DUF433 family)
MDRITIDSNICNGKPVVKGTRITVQSIFEFLQAGNTLDEILLEYPALSLADINSCYEFAARMASNSFHIESMKVN